jgi:hypothetical protein
MAAPSAPWSDNDRLLENLHRTTFAETSELEIDERLAAEDPEHEESMEFHRLNRERCSETAVAILKLLELLVPSDRISRSSAMSAGFQIFVLLWLLQSSKGDIGRMSMSGIAEKVGCSRALLSYYAKRFEKVLGFHGRGMKGKEASDSFIESSRRGWDTRRRRKAGLTDTAPVHVGLEEIEQPTADKMPRRFELEDEQEISADADGYSFDERRREYDLEESDI